MAASKTPTDRPIQPVFPVARLAELAQRAAWRGAAVLFLIVLTALSLCLRRRIYVIVSPYGNLGNRLFLFANLIAHSIATRSITINAGFGAWRRFFADTRRGPLPLFPALPLPPIADERVETLVRHLAVVAFFIALSPRFSDFWGAIETEHDDTVYLDSEAFADWSRGKRVILLRGYNFLSTRSMPRFADQIRPYFRQIIDPHSDALAPVQRLRSRCDRVIGVVIRQSGYDQWLGGRYFFAIPTYLRWIRQAASLWPEARVGFFICCDVAVDLGELSDLTYEFRAQHDLENRAALAHCDAILAPTSSYAAWAAFMARIPAQLLVDADQCITTAGFKPVLNHPDFAPPDYPRLDITPTRLQSSPL
jgi:hypothetical protein